MKIIVYNIDIISLSKRQNGLRKRGNNKQNVSCVLFCEASASVKLETNSARLRSMFEGNSNHQYI